MKIFYYIIINIIICIAMAAVTPVLAALQNSPSAPRQTMPDSVREARVRNLFQRAKNAQMAGNLAEAKRLWSQAKSIDPSLVPPVWLDRSPAPIRNPSEFNSSKVLLRRTASMTYDLAKPLLEDWLRRFPTDETVRTYYLTRAEAAGDLIQARRHRAVLHLSEQTETATPLWKYLLLTILGLFLGWQGRAIYLDLVLGRKS
ncbi:MAG TPA: hypothetical protein VIV61_05315 [Candidatus Ozemobacteraceae bacterium]